MKHENYLDTKNRMVTIIYEVLISLFTGYFIVFKFTKCGESKTPYEHFMLTLSAGFHIYDLLALAWLKLLDKDRLFHHSIVIGGLINTLTQNSGT